MEFLCTWTLYFFIYSSIGWMCEVAYSFATRHQFVNCGLLNGPICPVYGTGALAVILLLTPFRQNFFVLFIMGVVITSSIEYITSFALEKIFHTSWWDYSAMKFNLNGRICLRFSLLFGTMATVLMLVIHPFVQGIVGKAPFQLQLVLCIVMAAVFIGDLTVTVLAILKLNIRLKRLNAMMNDIKEKLDLSNWYANHSIKERLDKLFENRESNNALYLALEELSNRLRHTEWDNMLIQRRLFRAFPNLRSNRYGEHLKEIIEQWKNRRKK